MDATSRNIHMVAIFWETGFIDRSPQKLRERQTKNTGKPGAYKLAAI